MPKRKFEEVQQSDSEDSPELQASSDSLDDDSNGSTNSLSCGSGQSHKKKRKSVNFEQVQVFYFPRAQGFACVPSQGGTTLGMTEKHAHQEEYPFKHYRKLRKLVRRKKADVEESAENSFNIDSINDISQDEIVQTDSEEDDTETDGFFLQPVPIRVRRTLLKHSGVKKVDSTERDECKELRGSREECGCDCKTICNPETCLCAINGIQCQVDRFSFPCGCTKRGCANPSGRIEFNPNKVRKHYQHTMSRIEQEAADREDGGMKRKAGGSPAAKRAKHIRFSDEGDAVEGELSFNSTETGCCLDCSLTSTFADAGDEYTHLSCGSAADLHAVAPSVGLSDLSPSDTLGSTDVDVLDTFSNFPSEQVASQDGADNHAPCSSHVSNGSLEPISGLLNPILNTMDSLDMYSLPHLNQPATDSATDAFGATNSTSMAEWQSLPHESLLTTNSLIPMKDCPDQDSLSSEATSSQNSLELPSPDKPSFSLTNLKSSPLSFQLPSSHNVVHAMNSEFDEMEQCKHSPNRSALSTEASA